MDSRLVESKSIPDPNSGCWLWEGSVFHNGYGVAWKDGKNQKAHRVSWEAHNGHIPEGMCVCHSCDTPSCVNPDHLFLGTHKENMEDKAKKGRAPSMTREEHPMTILSSSMIEDIRESYTGAYGEIVELAKMYNVNRNTIKQAVKGLPNWKSK